VRITQRIQPVTPTHKLRVIKRDEHHIDWIPPPQQDKAQVDGLIQVMDGVGWTVAALAILVFAIALIVQIGRWFFGW